MKSKTRVRGCVQNAIKTLGYEQMKQIYIDTPTDKFCRLYHTSTKYCKLVFGAKNTKKPYVKREVKVPIDQNIRAGINSHRWQYPKENRYWEKIGEVRNTGYLKTSLLP